MGLENNRFKLEKVKIKNDKIIVVYNWMVVHWYIIRSMRVLESRVRWFKCLSFLINENEQALYMIPIVCMYYQRSTSYIVD